MSFVCRHTLENSSQCAADQILKYRTFKGDPFAVGMRQHTQSNIPDSVSLNKCLLGGNNVGGLIIKNSNMPSDHLAHH